MPGNTTWHCIPRTVNQNLVIRYDGIEVALRYFLKLITFDLNDLANQTLCFQLV